MSGESVALGLIFLIHVVGMGLLFGVLLLADDSGSWRGWWPRDERDDGSGPGLGPPAPPRPSAPASPRPDEPPPLPAADPSRVRLREPGRLGDALPHPPRRPDHVPERAPARAR